MVAKLKYTPLKKKKELRSKITNRLLESKIAHGPLGSKITNRPPGSKITNRLQESKITNQPLEFKLQFFFTLFFSMGNAFQYITHLKVNIVPANFLAQTLHESFPATKIAGKQPQGLFMLRKKSPSPDRYRKIYESLYIYNHVQELFFSVFYCFKENYQKRK